MRYYITPRNFGGLIIPIPIQNAYLRNFSKIKEIEFSLPVSEVCFPKKYPTLIGLLKTASLSNSPIVFVSILQLPFDIAEEFEVVLDKFPEFKKIIVIAALENTQGDLFKLWKKYKSTNYVLKNATSKLSW